MVSHVLHAGLVAQVQRSNLTGNLQQIVLLQVHKRDRYARIDTSFKPQKYKILPC